PRPRRHQPGDRDPSGGQREDRPEPPDGDLLEAPPQQPHTSRALRAQGGHRHVARRRRGVSELPAPGPAQVPVAPEPAYERLVDLVVQIAQTPSPTFEEDDRAALVSRLWRDAGLVPERDGVGNVVATVPGGQGETVLVAAHLDSVFPRGTDVKVRREGDRLLGPGVGDNAASLAVLTAYLQEPPERRPRLVVAATVGEEGAGDLRGARRVVADWAGDIQHFVALDGHLGSICHQGVGSLRHEVTMTSAGGHSWG